MDEARGPWLNCCAPAAAVTDIMVVELILRPPHFAQRANEWSGESSRGSVDETLFARVDFRG